MASLKVQRDRTAAAGEKLQGLLSSRSERGKELPGAPHRGPRAATTPITLDAPIRRHHSLVLEPFRRVLKAGR